MLTPVRIQRGDAVRAKLAELGLQEQDLLDAVACTRPAPNAKSKRIQPLVSRATATELIRMLAYPKFKLGADDRQELLADYLPNCKTVRIPNPPPKVPACRDPFDLPFLQLAVAGRAVALITVDQDLLSLAPVFACPIMSADQFLKALAA